MLTEQFIASISVPIKANTGLTKDAGIFLHELQPLPAQRHLFKKSITAPHCLAVSPSHVFAAQEGKAVIHVYSREKGNQECLIPFQERIHCVECAGKDGEVLLIGCESGRVLIWEVYSGRLVSTTTAHLQPVTSIVVSRNSNFFLTGSTDAQIHVWSLPAILSFTPDTSRTPIHTLSSHRDAIAAIVCGHSSSPADIALSLSSDKSAIVWDYRNGVSLRTYLLPEKPTATVLDPADRAFYVGYEDGSIQTLCFFDDEVQQSASTDTLRDGSSSHRPIQPSPKTRFNAESQNLGSVLSLALSWDGTTLLSGHTSGKVVSWDIVKGAYLTTVANLPGPVTNLECLEPTGWPKTEDSTTKIHTVTKPKHDVRSLDGHGIVPADYGINVQFTKELQIPSVSATEVKGEGKTEFEEALTHPSFPNKMLEESLAELESWDVQANGTVSAPTADFVSFDGPGETLKGATSEDSTSKEEMEELKKQLAALQRVQKVTFDQLADLRADKEWFLRRERKRMRRKADKRNGIVNGDNEDSDVEMGDGEDDDESTSASDDADSNEEEDEEDTEEDEEHDEGSSKASESGNE